MKSIDADGSPIAKWIRDHLDYPHKDYCLIWPFSRRSGYGFLICDGKTHSAHRFICELKNGPPPNADDVAAHSCNRGEDACVNHWHISWKTKAENQQDRTDREGRGRCKLTPEQASQIRAVATLEPRQVTADRFGVSIVTVRYIQSGKTWRGDRRRRSDLTAQQVLQIRELRGKKNQQAIADEMGLPLRVVARVLAGKSYSFVTDADAA
jgi:hypothetical protein